MDITFKVQGADQMVQQLKELGTNKIPLYVALGLTTLADTVQDGLIQHVRQRLTVRTRWLTKGYKYGINRYRASKTFLQAEVWTQAPWLLELEEGGTKKRMHRLSIPLALLRASRLDPKKIPKRLLPRSLKRSFLLTTKHGSTILYRRKGKGKRSKAEPLYVLKPEVRIPKRLELMGTARHYLDRQWKKSMDYALAQAAQAVQLGGQ